MNVFTLNGEQYEVADKAAREGKADKSYVDDELAKKANQTDVDTALAGKSPNIDDNQASTDHPWSGNKSKKYADDKSRETAEYSEGLIKQRLGIISFEIDAEDGGLNIKTMEV